MDAPVDSASTSGVQEGAETLAGAVKILFPLYFVELMSSGRNGLLRAGFTDTAELIDFTRDSQFSTATGRLT